MTELADLLKRFNRKERNLLVRAVLGDKDDPLKLIPTFCKDIESKLQIKEIQPDAWWATDYHINWLAGALQAMSVCIQAPSAAHKPLTAKYRWFKTKNSGRDHRKFGRLRSSRKHQSATEAATKAASPPFGDGGHATASTTLLSLPETRRSEPSIAPPPWSRAFEFLQVAGLSRLSNERSSVVRS